MIGRIVWLGLTWALLLALAGGQFLISGIHMSPQDRPVVLFLAGAMVVTVAFVYMNLGSAPIVARGFAVAAVFWLIVILGLGSMDALTRHLWLVGTINPK